MANNVRNFPNTTTPVHTESGPKPIETVEVGERVWAYDRQECAWLLATVTRNFQRTNNLLVNVTLTDGTTITGTDGHPFWVIEGEGLSARRTGDHGHDESFSKTPGRWVAMGDLRTGDALLSRDANIVHVASAATRRAAEPAYNLEVEGLHSYAVAAGVLVHNADYPLDEFGRPIEKAARDAATDAARAVENVAVQKPTGKWLASALCENSNSSDSAVPIWPNRGIDSRRHGAG